ncbi:hypothetical protein [Desulfoluna sp.]|uniref:hypothetical protein n=1 Tax=Desulfoluna sp. TaxID=2045199 RepID=UPI002601DD62|nr:hypothetical protein [Desulfoluna sp.]
MRKIIKEAEPEILATWKRSHPNGRYRDLDEGGYSVREGIRAAALKEQQGLCCYCCKSIDLKSCHNEHLEPQRTAPQRSLDFCNIVASCNTRRQCGDAHESKHLPLTPLMDACETELSFRLNGKVRGLTGRADRMIEILKLGNGNNRMLQQTRKIGIDALLFTHIGSFDSLELLGDDLLSIFLEDIESITSPQLPAYQPVLVNILKQELQK